MFLDQVGVPVPGVPVLLAAGALAGSGELRLDAVIALVAVSAVAADGLWYAIGRARGMVVLRLLCRISLEPDSCVRTTEGLFERHGARSLLVAKFVPGLQTAAPPLAGVFQLPLVRFLLWDAAGALLWAAVFVGTGALFHDQLAAVLGALAPLGAGLAGLVAFGLLLYWAVKLAQRQAFLRSLRVARIAPDELQRLLGGGEPVQVVDLRHALEREADPRTVPGALAIRVEEIAARHGEIARDRDIILFCT